jgi:hypothetical protein
MSTRSHRLAVRGADSQSAAPALLPALGGHAKTRVEKSLDAAGTSACATGPTAEVRSIA